MQKKVNTKPLESSFRDPSGFVFCFKGKIFRQINRVYKENYDLFINSGLYKELESKKLLIKHKEINDWEKFGKDKQRYIIIEAEKIDFISYPYEWCFSQLREAALLTLKIQKIALKYDISLKDASAYNIQFHKGQAIFIDTLSFEKQEKNNLWLAYRQFCEHFLAPLALMCYCDARLSQLQRTNINGIPLNLAAKMLPLKVKLNFSLLTHIVLQSKMQTYYADKEKIVEKTGTRHSLLALLDSLETCIKKMKPHNTSSQWGSYYDFTNYDDTAFAKKKELLKKFLNEINPRSVWDLGANNGEFSRIAAKDNTKVYSFDIDYNALEKNYQRTVKKQEKNILPLFLDLSNPSPSVGWANKERYSLEERGPADAVLALALIHHLAIGNNLPFENIADYFSRLGKYLIIEFVPKDDSKVKKLLSTRADIFPFYRQDCFENIFSQYFDIVEKEEIKNSQRTIYLLKRIINNENKIES